MCDTCTFCWSLWFGSHQSEPLIQGARIVRQGLEGPLAIETHSASCSFGLRWTMMDLWGGTSPEAPPPGDWCRPEIFATLLGGGLFVSSCSLQDSESFFSSDSLGLGFRVRVGVLLRVTPPSGWVLPAKYGTIWINTDSIPLSFLHLDQRKVPQIPLQVI